MTALDAGIGGANTLGGTLAATLGTLNGGTLGMLFVFIFPFCKLHGFSTRSSCDGNFNVSFFSSSFLNHTGGGATNKKMSKAFGNAWRGAAAYHYYMLALKQFYDGMQKSFFFLFEIL